MESRATRVKRILSASLAVALLAACAAPPPARAPESAAARAQSAAAAGRWATAAELWLEAAERDPAAAPAARLRAADAWWQAGEVARARDLADAVDRAALSRQDTALLDLLQGEFAVRAADPETADFYLGAARGALPRDYARRLAEAEAASAALRADPAAPHLARARSLAEDTRAYRPEQALQLLAALENVSSGTLRARAETAGGDDAAWFDLALRMRGLMTDPSRLEGASRRWADDHPGFVIGAREFLDLGLRYRATFQPPSRVAVLLPETGTLSGASAAIRDGLVTAWLENPGGARLSFYDTGEAITGAAAAYLQAIEDGADWVIGPLRREAVDAVLALPVLATPTLALNRTGPGQAAPEAAAALYTLALSQEEEVAATAHRALASGLDRAIAIVPQEEWGQRMLEAFEGAFEAGGGELVEVASYLPSESDHSALLTALLRLDESAARREALENRLGLPLSFEPRRRDDFDVIFLAATPQQGRQLRPQLKFFDAGDKPVFATARVYPGLAEDAPDPDLDGIAIPLTPWQLDAAVRRDLPPLASLRDGRLAGLHAVGRDAWQVLPWLELMRKDGDFAFPGDTGNLSLESDGSLVREPAWAVFRNGRPAPLPAPPEGS